MIDMGLHHIGLRIRLGRERKGITQGELAKLVGANSDQQVSKWERGLTPDTTFFLALGDALDVTLDWLAGRDITTDDPQNLQAFFLEIAPTLATIPTDAEAKWLREAFRNHGDPSPEVWHSRLNKKRRGKTAAVIIAGESATARAQAKGDAAGTTRRK